ncbi:MAG: asparagine synthase (glutamine-hydrolyzing) [Planctomycetes bacterium]|nr:asparagine synthase (glutamine-hydrolyzing) [Planctomycetota bacterium]
MCGIAGLVDFAGALNNPEGVLREMAATLRHRGPDASGVWFDAKSRAGLAHTRLKIIDCTDAAAQPMRSISGRFTLVYNGEIYNFHELRDELQMLGASFRSQSDTEVLLAAVEQWGVQAAARRTVGMFAFAIHDAVERKLHLVRDRIGIKPLHYGWIGAGERRTFVFASELKAIAGMPGFERAVDREALAAYFQFLYVPAPRTIWKGISKLEPARVLTLNLDSGETQTAIYWNARAIAERGIAEPFEGGDEQAEEALFRRIQEAVDGHMVADVPIGSFLSGGIDSTLVTAMMQSLSSRPIQTFTVGFNEGKFDERVFADNIARHLRTDHTSVQVSPHEMREAIPQLADMYDEPFADSSQLPTYVISRMARRSVKVALSGDGGDELFAGYNRHRVIDEMWGTLQRIPGPLRVAAARTIQMFSTRALDAIGKVATPLLPESLRSSQFGDHLHKFASLAEAKEWGDAYVALVSAWNEPSKLVIGARGGANGGTHIGEGIGAGHSPAPEADMPDALRGMQWLDQTTYLVDDILTKVDRASMAASLETRVPLLDHRLVEFAWTLPADMKVRNGQGKWLLRKVLNRFVPAPLHDRPKMGFAIPLEEWLRGPLRKWADALLEPGRIERHGFLNKDTVAHEWSQLCAGKGGHQHRMWAVLMWMKWAQRWKPTS